MAFIGFGKFNRFYLLILWSSLLKILIYFFFKVESLENIYFNNISILKSPVLNDHILVRFTYYYFGFVVLGLIYAKVVTINREFFNNSIYKEKWKSSLKSILLVVIIFIIYEMLTFYVNQRNMAFTYFWVLEILFIHFLLSKKENLKLYRHQKLSFAIILLFSFGTNFVSSFLRQCEYPIKDPDKEVDDYIKKTNMTIPSVIESLRKSIIVANNRGTKACSNEYNILLLDKYFEYFIVLVALGYLISSFLKSYSGVKLKLILNQNFVPIDIIIILIGICGFVLNIILLIISSFFACGKDKYIHQFCNSVVPDDDDEGSDIYYFDNLFLYYRTLTDDLYPRDKQEYRLRKPKDIIIEIIFSIIFLPICGFYKMRFDFSIIKELGVFHLLIPEAIYQFAIGCYQIIYKIIKNKIDGTQITQLIFFTISQVFALIGILIYIEIIELRFCKLDENIKNNIANRANEDFENPENIERTSEMSTFPLTSTLLDNNNEDKKNDDRASYTPD